MSGATFVIRQKGILPDAGVVSFLAFLLSDGLSACEPSRDIDCPCSKLTRGATLYGAGGCERCIDCEGIRESGLCPSCEAEDRKYMHGKLVARKYGTIY